MPTSFVNELLTSLSDRGRAFMRRSREPAHGQDLVELGEHLLSRRGEASGVALARGILDGYAAAPLSVRLSFLTALADRFGPDMERLERALDLFRQNPGALVVQEVEAAAGARRQELIRRLNLAPGGTAALVRMREELLEHLPSRPDLRAVERDFVHLFSSWFNRGFLVLKHIDWTTPANILEKIIRYEAVHEIRDWDDLRNRLEPPDRRCFAFFHPQLVDEPLIFVEVALTTAIPEAIAPLLDLKRKPIPAREATTAVFYSISNTQRGLGGVTFGNFLIKQVVEDLTRDLPNLKTFVTLSPAPGFAAWLARERKAEASACLDEPAKATLVLLDEGGWELDSKQAEALKKVLVPTIAYYFLKARTASGRTVDPVARFHLGNGARLESLDFLGDTSAKGLAQSLGFMVNYLYALDEIERNHEAFAEKGAVAASSAVRKALRADLPARDLVPVP